MVHTCPACNQEVPEEEGATHFMGHVMSNVTSAFAHNEAFQLAAQLTGIAITSGRPMREVVAVYQEAVRALMESGLFKG